MANHNLPIRTPNHASPEGLYPWLPKIIGHEGKSLSGFYDKYRTSEYGKWHAKQRLRFAQTYPYDAKQMLADLGDDIDPVEHSWYTLENIALPFIDAQQETGKPYTEKERMLLILATLLHDVGECTHPELRQAQLNPPGDIGALDKTHQDIVDEERVWRYIIRQVWPDLPQVTLDECGRIVFGGHKLSKDFNTIERIGYFTTGIKAARKLYASSEAELHLKKWDHLPFDELKRRNSLGALATHVCHTLAITPDRHGNHYQILLDRRDEYPYVNVILQKYGEFARRFITGENDPYGSTTRRAHSKAAEAIVDALKRAPFAE